MTARPIRLLGDPVLRTACDPVTAFDAALRALVRDMMDTLRARPGRAALAANQIGVPLRVIVWDTEGARGHLVNPTVVLGEGHQSDEEGCLSIPGLYYPTPRAMHATAYGVDEHGEPVTISGTGMLARAFQHEADHLEGRLYVDTLKGETRRRALREIRAASWSAAS